MLVAGGVVVDLILIHVECACQRILVKLREEQRLWLIIQIIVGEALLVNGLPMDEFFLKLGMRDVLLKKTCVLVIKLWHSVIFR